MKKILFIAISILTIGANLSINSAANDDIRQKKIKYYKSMIADNKALIAGFEKKLAELEASPAEQRGYYNRAIDRYKNFIRQEQKEIEEAEGELIELGYS